MKILRLTICSNGEGFKNINKTNKVRKLEKKLKRRQRSLSRKLKRKEVETANKNIKKDIEKLQKLHGRLSNIRTEYIRYIINSLVKQSPKFIQIEDLNVKA